MHHEIVTSIIAGVFSITSVVITVILAPLLFSTRRHAKTAAEQTKNTHSENLRDDLDLVIVSLHRLNAALGVENTLVRERAHKVEQRRKSA